MSQYDSGNLNIQWTLYGSEDTNITKLLIPHLLKKSSAIYPLSKRQYMKNKGSGLKLAIANEFCIFFFLRTNKTTIICWYKFFYIDFVVFLMVHDFNWEFTSN